MQLVEYANVLVAQETADPADVGFYVKSIDILLTSMRMADEEELDYTYEINPIREDETHLNQYRYVSDTCFKLLFQMGNNRSGKTTLQHTHPFPRRN